ncbi:50S ribosomal protein L15 [endosymbiont of Sipalinus gigas]|uniref:50S ribosomal protein L15 n=1 Tax=endosymbiont of Sipalinus gigas TaxID=1972134 RepID=UPI000DC7297D|nr:50S ribosomal protein L15 [endosymbiont of Sipalinus gigas]BBA85247.1 50S ribosomal protein L15 [endosymbiont of Sipalinus gigas]
MLKLNSLNRYKSKKKKKRICRGIGSGTGKTGGRGNKGQKSRSGSRRKRAFEGGQTSICRRLPKFGFNNKNKKIVKELRLSYINNIKDNNINIDVLKKNKLINKNTKFVKLILDKKSNNICSKIIKKEFGISISKNVHNVLNLYGGKFE